jgi:hypothetical protein
MTITIKTLKRICVGLAIALILFAGWSIWSFFDYNAKKAKYEEGKRQSEQKIAAITAVAQHNYDAAVTEKKKADIAKKEKRNILIALKKEKEAHIETVEKIPEMVAEEVAEVTRSLINYGLGYTLTASDIYANAAGVQFTLVASQYNLEALYLLDFYATKQLPSMAKYITKQETQIFSLTTAYDTMKSGYLKLEEANKAHVAQDILDAKRIKYLEGQIGRAKFQATVKTVVAVGVGYAIVRWVVIPLFGGGK